MQSEPNVVCWECEVKAGLGDCEVCDLVRNQRMQISTMTNKIKQQRREITRLHLSRPYGAHHKPALNGEGGA